MTKFSLLAIAAFATSIATSIATTATELASQFNAEGGPETPAAEPTTTKRRVRPASTGTETPPVDLEKEKPAAGGKTIEELKELIKIPVEGGKGDKVKAFLTEHGATKVSDLAAEHHAAFTAVMKKLTLEVEAEQM